jgi:UDP-glucose 4-epimerase
MAKYVMIIGGTGFIGRWLTKRYLQDDYHVIVYGRSAGRGKGFDELSCNRLDFFRGDVLDPVTLHSAFEQHRPELVYYLAGVPYTHAIAHPQDALRVNVEGCYLSLEAAAQAGVKSVVVASSAAVYRRSDVPLRENDPVEPIDALGLSKLLMEKTTEYFAQTMNLRCVITRLFNVYGPYEANAHVISWIVSCLKQGNVVRLSNIKSKRDYVYVEDVAEMLYRCGHINEEGLTVLNIGTGTEYSVEEVVQIISRLLGRQVSIQIDSQRLRPVDRLHLVADMSKTRKVLNLQRIRSLEEGLALLLAHEGMI